MKLGPLFLLFAVLGQIQPAAAENLCTIIADADSGIVLHEQGDCRTRVTPASTFKIALSVMGYDSGVLTDVGSPALPFEDGYADWGEGWKQTTTPSRWMEYSVLWYSHHITAALGAERLEGYARAFGYGNADFSGADALERAWISTTLQIAPVEQVAFLRNLITRALPVNNHALEMTRAIMQKWDTDAGWTISGKTGTAFPRYADGTLDRARGWGWFVGWAEKGERTLVFARLDQDEQRHATNTGVRARDGILTEWDQLSATVP